MRLSALYLALILATATAYAQQPMGSVLTGGPYVGFDSNDYPDAASLPVLRRHFAFVGYWLNNPPDARQNSWVGKRETLVRNGFGFLVLFNGRLEAEIKKAKRSGTAPAALGAQDGGAAVVAAHRENFATGTIIFLDQEEGGRLTSDQAAYLFGWTEAVATKSGYLPGVYGSGQPVGDGPGKTITTVQGIREQVAAQHLHPIAFWVYQDACPPANGCTLKPPPLNSSGTPDIAVWQYAQSPRRKEITAACGKTYAADGNCYAPDLPNLPLDLSVSASADPSHGR